MSIFYPLSRWALHTSLLLAPVGTALAQGPVITGLAPGANAAAAARTSSLTVSFSQPLVARSAAALQVFSSQRGGRRTGTAPAAVTGNTLSFAPTAYPYMPGETVQYTVTTAAASSSGAVATARVGQFTAAAGGTGTGIFQPGPDLPVGADPRSVALGDLDGDGDLDFVVANFNQAGSTGTVGMCLNNGNGTFSSSQTAATGNNQAAVVLGDVDGDGDLDLLTANVGSVATVSVRLNNGSGIFSSSQEVSMGAALYSLVLGDVDGDGDLDLAATNSVASGSAGTVSICLNNGSGNFGGATALLMGTNPGAVVLGDVDSDGDLDLLATNQTYAGTVSLRLNNGSGTFGSIQAFGVGSEPFRLVLGDIDGDGDLDLLTANNSHISMVSVRLNDGSGNFSVNQDLTLGSYIPDALALADIDGDGDLDLLTTGLNGNLNVSTYVRVTRNDGTGAFNGLPLQTRIGNSTCISSSIALGDVDGDGDLDLLTANEFGDNTVSVRLNGNTVPTATTNQAATSLALFPNPAHGAATLTGAAPHASVTVLDGLGRLVAAATADATGTARLTLPTGLAAGVYLVQCGARVQQLVVE